MRRVFSLMSALFAALAFTSAADAAIHVTLTAGESDSFNYTFGSGTTGTSIIDGSFESIDSAVVNKDASGSSTPDTRITFNGYVGDFWVTFSIRTNFPGTTEKALITETTFTTRNDSDQLATISFRVDIDDFLLPGSSGSQMSLTNSISTTLLSADGSASIISNVSDINNVTKYTAASSVAGETYSASGAPTLLTFTRGNTFDMGNTISLTLGGGGEATITGTTVAALPEASSIVAWASVLGLAGIFHAVRRRR
jgi:hypothetical protein